MVYMGYSYSIIWRSGRIVEKWWFAIDGKRAYFLMQHDFTSFVLQESFQFMSHHEVIEVTMRDQDVIHSESILSYQFVEHIHIL